MTVFLMGPLQGTGNKVSKRSNNSLRLIEYVEGDTKNIVPLDHTLIKDVTMLPAYARLKYSVGGAPPEGGRNHLMNGIPVDPSTVPTRIRLKYKPDRGSDSHFCIFNFTLPERYVCDAFKDIVEAIEPGVHQFFRVEFEWKDGTSAGHRYLLNVCNRVDYIDREHSLLVKSGYGYEPVDGSPDNAFVHPEHVAGMALWYDKAFHSHAPFVSQSVVDSFHAAGLKGATFFPSFDRPWPGDA